MPVPRITREELKARLDSADTSSHPIIIDVRLKYPYEHSTVTLPGAERVLPDAVATALFPRDRDLVLYDSDPDDMVSSQAAAELVRRGHRAFVLQGGISEWVNAKLPVGTKSAPQPAAPAAKPAAAAGGGAKPSAAAPAAKPAAAASAANPAVTPGSQAPPAASSAAAAAPKSSGPAAVQGPAPPARSAPDTERSSES